MEASQSGPERDRGSGLPSSINVVCSFWRDCIEVMESAKGSHEDFDLEKERSGLDEQGLKIAENQEVSQKNRRKLAESTRDFKKASADDKLNLFNSLLKSYQEEVDNLTKRAKFGENSFLNIYQKLYEAPDPYPALASIADQDQKLLEIESENRKMKLELEEYRSEATHLRNQQATIRRLEERNRQLEQQMEEKVREIVEIKQRSLAEENQKTLEVLKERELLMQDQLRQAKESVINMQKLHEIAQSQLFELRTQSEEESAAKEAEVNLLMDEVERAQTRLLSLEREKGLLRSQVQSTDEINEDKKSDVEMNIMLESSLNAKEKIISELNMELHNMESTLLNEREQHLNEIKKLNALINEKVSVLFPNLYISIFLLDSALLEIRRELQERPTTRLVDDLRKKVKILQAVGYNSIEAEDWELASTGEEMSKLESLLLDKNRKMEHELTQLKVKISEKTSILEAAEAKIAELTAKVDEQQKLITKLEDDILKGYNSTERRGSLNDWDIQEFAEDIETGKGSKILHASKDSLIDSMIKHRDRNRDKDRERERSSRGSRDRDNGDLDKRTSFGKVFMQVKALEKMKHVYRRLVSKGKSIKSFYHVSVVSRQSTLIGRDLKARKSDPEEPIKRLLAVKINVFCLLGEKVRDERTLSTGILDYITLKSYIFGLSFYFTWGGFWLLAHAQHPVNLTAHLLAVRILREIKLLRPLKHDNIIALKDVMFGLARSMTRSGRGMSSYIATQWYRAPELLVCSDRYDTSIDMWYADCILAELLRRRPLFPGTDDINQLECIVNVLGVKGDAYLNFVGNEHARKYIKSLPQSLGVPFASVYSHANPLAIDLMKMLIFHPSK
ncbi:hypothetical protein ZIOFF_073652 [Zingiber officinale]|uniref:Protein kinase domain-containing protein n=1 Tax=Zingiber officinale TaxID=94328 RepID=A0A8J5ETU6_ZINOF|nr:hypothetical protein ZIOFF_073652 [Zingiber officinale]